ncbi:family 3 glycoside hydrolase [Suillus clintonianus]|uniref:family 3 glycoside hydrolase n=1 Tax=Suillus clintonianus TaxID=1904413 RepID=UPI001B8851F5|nr:family 3 glycoside hydrolase [Suillus clintonianus]KAG2110089.1 family 3 glycoside hydrolase [Suillus clintonianus]
MMNMGRIAQGGRNWEGFGADPFLSGEAAYETILGLQAGGVQATACNLANKHGSARRSLLMLMIVPSTKFTLILLCIL